MHYWMLWLLMHHSVCPIAGALRHSLQDRLSKGASGKSRDEIYLKLRTSTGWQCWMVGVFLVNHWIYVNFIA